MLGFSHATYGIIKQDETTVEPYTQAKMRVWGPSVAGSITGVAERKIIDGAGI